MRILRSVSSQRCRAVLTVKNLCIHNLPPPDARRYRVLTGQKRAATPSFEACDESLGCRRSLIRHPQTFQLLRAVQFLALAPLHILALLQLCVSVLRLLMALPQSIKDQMILLWGWPVLGSEMRTSRTGLNPLMVVGSLSFQSISVRKIARKSLK